MRLPIRVAVVSLLLVASTAAARRDRPGRAPRSPNAAVGTSPARAAACDHELLQSVAWTQTSAERRALCEQAFLAAADAYDVAKLVRGAGRATGVDAVVVDGAPPPDGSPFAVIVDIDETVLDNSPMEAEMIRRGLRTFDARLWNDWVARASAAAIPGAVAFTQHVVEEGGIVFYVSNRSSDQEDATRRNLARLGFPLGESEDVVLLRGEIDPGSDKTSRREHVARSHRVLLLVGDDLNDFVSTRGMDVAARDAQVEAARTRWGRSWFLLPNPMYGSWEQALTAGDDARSPTQRKCDALRGFER